MTTPQDLMKLGEALIAHCKEGQEEALWDGFYTADAVSVESMPMPDGQREAQGLGAIRAKNTWWSGAHEVHAMEVEGPYVHGSDRFCVIFALDATVKETQERFQMREVATYYVNSEGKINREEFAYAV